MLISLERSGDALDTIIADDDDIAIAAITVAELLVGVQLADRRRQERRAAFVEAVLTGVPVEIYDVDVARAHATLLAHATRSGCPRGAHDLIIAATALARDRVVATTDLAGFADLPDVVVRATS